MLVFTFIYSSLLIVLAVLAFATGESGIEASLAFFAGAITICALFSLKSPRHGFVGATVLSLLLAFSVLAHLSGSRELSTRELTISLTALALSITFVMAAHRAWQRYRRNMALEEMMKDEGPDG